MVDIRLLTKDELVMLRQIQYNPFENPAVLISPRGVTMISEHEYKETPMYQVVCPCGTTVRGNDKFYCPNCRRLFDLGVAHATGTLNSYHSYDELYEAFLVSPSENDLGYSQTALDSLLEAVTPETELYSGRALVKTKKEGHFLYSEVVGFLAIIAFIILVAAVH